MFIYFLAPINIVNPFERVSDILDRLDELQRIALALYFVGVCLAGLALHAFDDMTSLLILAAVGSIMSIPGSILIHAILDLFAQLFEGILSP